jgi:hypothetical protein
MKSVKLLFSSLLPVLCLASCATSSLDSSLPPPRPHVPQVTMSVPQNSNEQALIGEVENALERNGLRPTERQGVEYQLAFSVLQGPVNTDVTLDLIQGRERVVHAFARAGGPFSVFKKQQVVRQAFDKALQQFEAQLPRTGGGTSGGGSYQEQPYQNQSREAPAQPYGNQPTYGNPQQPYGGAYQGGGSNPYQGNY